MASINPPADDIARRAASENIPTQRVPVQAQQGSPAGTITPTSRRRNHGSQSRATPSSVLPNETLRSMDSTRLLSQDGWASSMAENNATSLAYCDSLLPEDDGMSTLRQRIIRIQQLDVSSDEKSRLMHRTMMEPYYASQPEVQQSRAGARQSFGSSYGPERPITPASSLSCGPGSFNASPQTSRSSICDEFVVSAVDVKPTFWSPSTTQSTPASESNTPTMSRKTSIEGRVNGGLIFGCKHYKRNVKLQCSSCLRWYTCRFCHDDLEDHRLIRKETQNMLCMYCGNAQPTAGECRTCKEPAACYYCSICKLWDNEPTRSIYHCDDCGICRVGEGLGKDFFHCKTCSACLSVSIQNTHKCIERSMDSDCPICGEYMFTSPQTVVFMRCGHSIHQSCYSIHMQSSFKCPICSRSIMNMEMSFRNLDRAIASQPMPPQFDDTKAFIYCNDCGTKSSVAYHWLGLKCIICDSYNTAQLRILSEVPLTIPTEEGHVHHSGPTIRESNSISFSLDDPSRGRTRSMARTLRRSAASSSTLDASRRQFTNITTRWDGRSVSEHLRPTSRDITENTVQIGPTGSDSEDEVAFWGGQSSTEGPLKNADNNRESLDASESEDSSDADDNIEFDDSDDEDPINIMGHR